MAFLVPLPHASYSYTALNLITWNYTLTWMRNVTEWKDYQPIFDSVFNVQFEESFHRFQPLSSQPIAGRFRMQNADFAYERPEVVGARPRLVRNNLGRAGLSESHGREFWVPNWENSHLTSSLLLLPTCTYKGTGSLLLARNRFCIAKMRSVNQTLKNRIYSLNALE